MLCGFGRSNDAVAVLVGIIRCVRCCNCCAAGDCGDLSVVYHSILNKFGSNLCFVYGRFIMIYHSILNKFGSNLCFGYGKFVTIYHSILNTFEVISIGLMLRLLLLWAIAVI